MRSFKTRLNRVLPNGTDDPGKKSFKLIVYFSIAIILIMVFASIITFFMTLEGEEHTLVPDVLGLELLDAIIELQEKGLILQLQQQIGTYDNEGTVLGQEPTPGTLVKVGRKIILRVSNGPIMDEVEDYRGMMLTEVELNLLSNSTIYGAVIKIKKPVMEEFNETPAGTILEQKPEPGTKITTLTELELVVSRGPQGQLVTVGDYVGLPFYEALRKFAGTNAPFDFTSQAAGEDEVPGTVISQSPAAGTNVQASTLVQFTIAEPDDIPENYQFGIIQRAITKNAVAIDLQIEVISPEGEPKLLARMLHPGGVIAIPYLEEDNSQIVVSSSLRELFRYTIKKKTE